MHEDSSALKVYPRGFMGARLKDRVQTETHLTENNMGFIPVKVSSFKKASGINTFNHEVEELYSAYIRESTDVLGFDFREKVLTTALKAFGTYNAEQWYLANLRCPFVSKMQYDFLDDTFEFLIKGRRKVSLENWNALVVIANDDGTNDRPSKIGAEFFGLPGSGLTRNHTNLLEVIQLWCSKPNGLEDLLGSLHILFGAAPQ